MNWKSRYRKTLKARLMLIGMILGLVGWFLLGVVLFGGFFEEELLEIERVLETPSFAWSFRAVIIAFTALLIWKHRWLARAWEQRWFRNIIYIYYAVGLIGWIAGLADLIA